MKLHIDIDTFFVSAHRIENKNYHNIPVAVGGRSNLSIFEDKKSTRVVSQIGGAFTSSILSSNNDKDFNQYFRDKNGKIRGIITTASYEARAYGVKTAMPVNEALSLCPHLQVIPPNYPLYHELSHKLKTLLQVHIPSIEQFSIDEFFGDISGWIEESKIYEFAITLQNTILESLNIPVSIGISSSKWIAKLATEFAKPFGIKYIPEDKISYFCKDIPISKFPGIGKGYTKRLSSHGIKTLGDIKRKKELFYGWGKPGIQLYKRACGVDNEGISFEKTRKSIGIGRTFDPVKDRDEIKRRITVLSRHLSFIAFKKKQKPLTYFLKIKYQYGEKSKDFINTNREFNEPYLKNILLALFDKIDIHPSHGIRQINITLSNFQSEKLETLNLFHQKEDNTNVKLTNSIQKLRDKFGIDIIKTGAELPFK